MKSRLLVGGLVALSLCQQVQAQDNSAPPRTPAPQSQPVPAPNRSLVNSASISLDYRVDRVGPSGIGKVEIWVTPDQGATWRRLAEETPRKGGFQIALPGEGLFGVRLVAVNGNGFGGIAPKRGDDANFWVEVDSTAPLVQLGSMDAYTDGAHLNICWTAQDRNLGPTPINLYYRSETEQGWQLIARNLKNSGQHRWLFPRDKGDRFHIRIESTDEAGNISHADTPSPIVLDMIEPQLIVVGVAVSAGQPHRSFSSPAAPTANPPQQQAMLPQATRPQPPAPQPSMPQEPPARQPDVLDDPLKTLPPSGLFESPR